jgi:predicted CopG family antitoxin
VTKKTISVTREVYDALISLKKGNMTFSDVILEMYDELYGTVDEDETDHHR